MLDILLPVGASCFLIQLMVICFFVCGFAVTVLFAVFFSNESSVFFNDQVSFWSSF